MLGFCCRMTAWDSGTEVAKGFVTWGYQLRHRRLDCEVSCPGQGELGPDSKVAGHNAG